MTIENLQIEVQATSNQATNSLEKLESVLQRIDALGNKTGFDKLYKKLKKIASLNFSGVESGLNSVDRAAEKMSRSTAKVDRFAKTVRKVREEIKSTREEYSKYQKLSNPLLNSTRSVVPKPYRPQHGNSSRPHSFTSSFGGNLGDGSPNWTRWNPWGSKQMYDEMLNAWMRHDFGNVPNSRRLGDGNTIRLDSNQWHEVGNLEGKFHDLKGRIKDTTARLKDYVKTVKDTDKESKKVNKTLGAMKTILMYSLMFSAVSAVTKGMTEGMQNVAMYSKEANDVLTEYKTTSLQLKNAIGSALVPVLQTFYPLIQFGANAMIDVSNAINMIFSALNGADTFVKAKKYTDDYAKSLGKLKGMAGMDQIHTIGNSYNYGEMFETVDIEGGDIAGTILKITALTTGITLLINMIKGVKFGDGFLKMAAGISKAYTYLKDASKWKKAGIAIATVGAEVALCHDAFYGWASGTKTTGLALLEFIPTVTAAGVAMYAMYGKAGLVIALIAGAGAAISGVVRAQRDLRNEMVNNAYFSDTGIKLDELSSAFESAWESTSKLKEESESMNGTLADLSDSIDTSYSNIQVFLSNLSSSSGDSATNLSDLETSISDLKDTIGSFDGELNVYGTYDAEAWKQLMTDIQTVVDTLDTSPELEGKYDSTAWKTLLSKVQTIVNTLDTNPELVGTYDKEEWETITGELDDLIADIDASVNFNADTEEFQKALDEIRKEVNNMVSDLQTQLNTRTEGIWKTFHGLAETAKADFTEQLKEMGGTFAEFAEIFEGSTSDLETKIGKLLDKASTTGGLTEGDKTNLEMYINMLNDLNRNDSVEKTTFENYIQNNLGQGLQIESVEQAQTLLNGLAEKANAYRSNIETSYNSAVNEIANLKRQNEQLHSWGYMSDEDYNNFNRRFDIALKGLTQSYNQSISNLVSDTESAANLIQGAALKNTSAVVGEAKQQWADANWADKNLWFWTEEFRANEEAGLVSQHLGSAETEIITPLTNVINEFFRQVGSNQSAWLLSEFQSIRDQYISMRLKDGWVPRVDYEYTGKDYDALISESIGKYATGGFPEDGLFMANHNELIGKFTNGKTAVANNEQIVSGIAKGVSEASSEQNDLLREQNKLLAKLLAKSGNGTISVSTITKGLERQNRRNGKVIVPVGN